LVKAVPQSYVVHTDDVAWWHSFFDWVDLMRSGVLQPLHRGEAVAFTPPAWADRGRQGAIVVPYGARFVVVEGVGAGRGELADLIDATIWVQVDEDARLSREAARVEAGDVSASLLEEWQREERPFLAAQRVWERADHVVAGSSGALTQGLRPGPLTDDVLVGQSRAGRGRRR
jgi:uridine kinase